MYYLYLEAQIIYLLHISCSILILIDCQLIFKIVFSLEVESGLL
jgi:hypothetical protein